MPSERLAQLLQRIDQLNSEDPHPVVVGDAVRPWELVYAQWLSEWVIRLKPDASEALRIAARGQHVRRWTIPRSRYDPNRRGYLRWREVLKAFHIQTVTTLMVELGYSNEVVERVRLIMSKRALPDDPETQTLEDALCLVFLERQFDELRKKTPSEKLEEILRKTWRKMSPQAQEEALRLPLGDEAKAVLRGAVILGSDPSATV